MAQEEQQNQPAQQPNAGNKQQDQQPAPSNDNNKKALKIILIILGVLVVLGILATVLLGFFFQKIGETFVEQATDSNIEVSDDGLSVESEDGSSFMSSEMPEDFPEEAPLFEPANLVSSTSQQQDGSASYTVTFSTEEDPQAVKDFYERELNAGGWEVTTTSTFNNTTHYQAEHESQMRASVSVAPSSEGTTSFSVAVSE